MSYTTRYHYSVVLLKERTTKSGKAVRSYERAYGYCFGLNPSAAAKALEAEKAKKNLIIDSICLRLSNEDGKVLLQTIKDDMSDTLPLLGFEKNKETNKYTEVEAEKDIHESNFDIYKFLTCVTRPYKVTPILRPEDHI
jgi:hypothetical protein